MKPTTPHTPEPMAEDDALAAEYALGLLQGTQRDAFAARLRAERPLAARVTFWQAQLAGSGEEIEGVEPPRRVKAAVMAATAPARAGRQWRGYGLWGLLGGALAVLVLVVFGLTTGPDFTPGFRAEIEATDQTIRLTALYDAKAMTLEVTLDKGSAPDGRVLELWAIAGDSPPVSLGVLAPGGASRLTVDPALAATLSGAILAVSEEPPGGSPKAGPTGEVLATGPVVAL